MLLPMEIDLSHLKSTGFGEPEVRVRNSHADFLEVWMRHGILIYGGREFHQSPIMSQVVQLSPDLRKSWQTAFQHCPRVRSNNPDWDGLVDPADLSKSVENPTLIIVEDSTAESLYKVSSSDYSALKDVSGRTVEVVRFTCIRRSRLIQETAELSGSQIKSGEKFESLWSRRFLWLARAENLRQISVVDGWAFKNSEVKKEFSINEVSGSRRFLKYLCRSTSSEKYVKFYTSWGGEDSEWTSAERKWHGMEFARLIQAEMRECANGNVKEVDLHIIRQSDFKRIYHDRYIRFGNYIVDLGNGLLCFEGADEVRSTVTSSFKSGKKVAEDYRKGEINLSENRSPNRIRLNISSASISDLTCQV